MTLKKSLDFYEKGLGWKKSDKSMDGLALFPLGGITLALHPRHELADDTTLHYQPTEFSGLTISYNAKSEKEVDDILKQVAKLGATITKPAQKVYWGGYSGHFKDLDGHLFESCMQSVLGVRRKRQLKTVMTTSQTISELIRIPCVGSTEYRREGVRILCYENRFIGENPNISRHH